MRIIVKVPRHETEGGGAITKEFELDEEPRLRELLPSSIGDDVRLRVLGINRQNPDVLRVVTQEVGDDDFTKLRRLDGWQRPRFAQ